jgi:hypothetical protein
MTENAITDNITNKMNMRMKFPSRFNMIGTPIRIGKKMIKETIILKNAEA